MKYHGVYYIPNQGAQLSASLDYVKAIVAGIESSFPRADKAGTWALTHRMLRDNPPYSETTQPDYPHAYQHLLHVSTVTPDRAYNLIQHPPKAGQDGSVSTTPQIAIASFPMAQGDAHATFLANQMPLLWTPPRMLDVVNGKTFQAGDFLIYVGELRSRRQAQTSNHTSPAVVVCVSTHAGGPDNDDGTSSPPTDDGAIDFEYAQASIRELWNTIKKDITFGRAEVREHMQPTEDFGRGEEQNREAVVRMWCEALSPRA
ncbi:hypothetical protein DPSP01_005785 [Paraphaeosphaeria sporulosa]|uniref:Mediator of RNA polymerase II transcription subunit 20 n=1 Tax=Paraphaeosphaeria sporulosa TaxID=1460663 RepID=A0A177CCF3_9PLEO|nr:uncharacterized protein CC84DRAFT_1217934 [Paraphaeosphaeria sporulosa]OAG04487.1 hypothetical protein CC84DRAFT_1217934 [Paraphaeosphaeria sporulosa]